MATVPSRVDTAVVGGGQSALTMSWYLQRAGRDHVLLERRTELGGGWRDRWDGFRLVGPNWTAGLPDDPYPGGDPDAYMPRDAIAERIAGYARRIGAPVVLGAGVSRLGASGDGFILETAQGTVRASRVILATGGFHRPHIPAAAAGLSSRVLSLHSHAYRRPSELPDGGVLIVGTGQTGVQLTQELRAAGREVWLSVGSAGRVPRRFRGRDSFWWLVRLIEDGPRHGFGLPTAARLPDPRRRLAGNVQLTGHGSPPETVDLRAWAADGVHLVGRVAAIDGERVTFGDDLETNLAFAERFFDERFLPEIEGLIEAAGIEADPPDPPVWSTYRPPAVESLDLAAAGLGTVLWTSGYRQDWSWIDLPVTDELGFLRQHEGLTEVPGLSVIGSHWQHDQTSSTLFGMPRDARVLARHLGLVDG